LENIATGRLESLPYNLGNTPKGEGGSETKAGEEAHYFRFTIYDLRGVRELQKDA
jgi:hypothetical protein